MPNAIDFVSDVPPPAVAETPSWYSSGLPNWYGHHRIGFVTCSCGYAAGSKTISRRSFAFSVTVWDKEIEVVPAFAIVPPIVVVTGAFVALIASTYPVRSAAFVAGRGRTVFTYGSRSATGPVVSRNVSPQSPAFMSGASGFQSTVQKERSLQPCAGAANALAILVTPPAHGCNDLSFCTV